MRLREFTTPAEVPHYSCAITPGRHCPLFGAASVLRSVAGVTLIYVGTQDCVYYAQKDALTRQLGGAAGRNPGFRTLAVQLSDADLIFGIREQLEALLEREALREGTRAVFLVTSCSVEVISEDLLSVVQAASRRTGRRIALIPTENFKTFSYVEGIEDTLRMLTADLKPRPTRPGTFAVLGARQPGAERCEPVQYLLRRGFTLHSILPYDTDAERIESLAEAAFTLAVDGTGLEVGERMRQRFGIPCIRFDRRLSLEHILAAWRELGEITGEDVEPWLREKVAETEALAQRAREKVEGKTFFYGQKVLYPFEACLFFMNLGMIPTCVFLGSTMDKTDEARLAVAARADPLVWLNASQADVQAMLGESLPDYSIGIVGGAIRRCPVTALSLRIAPVEVGFAFYQYCLQALLEAEEKEAPHEGI